MKKLYTRMQLLAVILAISLALMACGSKETSDTAGDNSSQDDIAVSIAEDTAAEDSDSVTEQTENTPEKALSESLSSEAEQVGTENVPAVMSLNYYDDDVNLMCGGFKVLSEGFDELSEALHDYNLEMKDFALSYKEDLEADPDYKYEGTAVITRCDSQIFSCKQERYVYLGMSDTRPSTVGFTCDVSTGKTLWLGDVVNDNDQFENILRKKIEEHPDSAAFSYDWDNDVESALWGDVGMGWYLTDEGMEIVFGKGLLNPTDQTTIKISYDECGTFLDSGCIRKSDRICHLVDDYGMYCLEYSFDADGDGKEELLQIDSDYEVDENHYVQGVRPIISFGRDENSLTTVYGDYAYEIRSEWVMESAGGKFYLYEDVLGEEDGELLRIYDLSDPDKGPAYIGFNRLGAFYSFIPADPDHIYVEDRVYMIGTYSGYTACSMEEDGQLSVAEEPEYLIINMKYNSSFEEGDDHKAPGIGLTLKQDLETYVYDITSGDGEDKTLPEGTVLYPYACGGEESYMIFCTDDGKYVTLYYDDRDGDEWEYLINGIPEGELLDGFVYAG